MLKKWLCFQALIGNQVHTFVGKLDYPFSRSIDAARDRHLLCFENLLLREGDRFHVYPQGIVGATGQVRIRKSAILCYTPLKEAAVHWEKVWNEALET